MSDLTITRRHLPHWNQSGAWYYVTFCVKSGSLSFDEQVMVLQHIKRGHMLHYRLIAASVMPDHVHVILVPKQLSTLARTMKALKGTTARLINICRGSVGSIWQSESWDRILRSEDELIQKLKYMFQNPVDAGLCDDPSSYRGWHLQS